MKTSTLFGLVVLIFLLVPIYIKAFTIQGHIHNAESSFIYLTSSWQRKDTLRLDAQGYFQTTITHSPYEKVFYLSWTAKDSYGRLINILVDPTDIVEIQASGKREKMTYLRGDLKRKQYLNFLLEKTSVLNHWLYKLEEVQQREANQEIFRYLDTLFVQDPLLAVECIGFMRYTLFTDDFRWEKMPKIWTQLNAIPDSIKLNSKIFQGLDAHFWPGKTMCELNFLDSSQVLHLTKELSGLPLLVIFEPAYRSAKLSRAEFLIQYEKLHGKVNFLTLAEEPYFEDWQKWVCERPLPWLQGFWVADEQMSSLQLLEHFHGTPHSILLDQNRKIIAFNPDLETLISFAQKNH